MHRASDERAANDARVSVGVMPGGLDEDGGIGGEDLASVLEQRIQHARDDAAGESAVLGAPAAHRVDHPVDPLVAVIARVFHDDELVIGHPARAMRHGHLHIVPARREGTGRERSWMRDRLADVSQARDRARELGERLRHRPRAGLIPFEGGRWVASPAATTLE